MIRSFCKVLIGIILFSVAAFSQNPSKWTLSSEASGRTLQSGESINAKLTADIEDGWHLYALDQPAGGPIATTIKVSEGLSFTISGKIGSPAATIKRDELFTGSDGKPLETKYFEKSVTFSVPLNTTADASGDDLKFDVRFQLCKDTLCLPPKTIRVSFTGVENAKGVVGAQLPVVSGNRTDAAGPKPATDNRQPTTNNQPPTDLWSFILLAMGAGLLSLLTPCVFPMIPITVSYFTNHAGGSRARSIRLASVYSIGIIATFTILGMLLAVFVGASGIQVFSANPWVNLLITAIFLFFAFNLFGAYEITVPSGILTKLDGLTRSREGEGSGIIGALLMGLTFTVTSFTCTSPFIGSIMVSSAEGNWQMPLVGMLAFSTVFALPFFVLALAPQLVAQLPRAGGWMNSIKVSMGFLEVAAAMKFLSNVDLVWDWGIFTRDVVLSVWIAIGVILAVYLLGKFQLFHDTRPERIGAVRLVSAIVSLAVSFYLLTGLFGAKLGELESFLPPDTNTSSRGFLKQASDEPDWIENDYPKALEQAKTDGKYVFVDFTGYTCTNCRWMEANIFTVADVKAELEKFVRVQLYTDREGELYERHQQMEQDMFGTVALPFYAVVDEDGEIIASFPGLTRNVPEFVDFLRQAAEELAKENMRLPVQKLIDGLCSISDEDFVCDNVYQYLGKNLVDVDSISKYFHWSPSFYTRNLIYKDARFEMMAICWESGQVSRIHNHSEQRCWMTVPVGKLRGQNFAVQEIDESLGHCKLRETDAFEMSENHPAKVELEEPVHQILNLAEYGERAVSLHIYSKPYDRCLSYCIDTDTFKEVQLYYTSIDGKLCDGVRL